MVALSYDQELPSLLRLFYLAVYPIDSLSNTPLFHLAVPNISIQRAKATPSTQHNVYLSRPRPHLPSPD